MPALHATVTVRLSADAYEKIADLAKQDGKSISRWVAEIAYRSSYTKIADLARKHSWSVPGTIDVAIDEFVKADDTPAPNRK